MAVTLVSATMVYVMTCTLGLLVLPCGGRRITGEQALVPAPAQAPSEVTPYMQSMLHADNGGPADVGVRSLPPGPSSADCFRESDEYPKVLQSTSYTPAQQIAIMQAQIRANIQAMQFSCAASGGCWKGSGPLNAGWCDYMCSDYPYGYGKRRRLSQAPAPGTDGSAQASLAAAPAPSPTGALLCPGNITPINATEHTTLCECRGYKKAWRAAPQPLTQHQKAVLRDCEASNTDAKQRYNVTKVELGSCADVTIHLHND